MQWTDLDFGRIDSFIHITQIIKEKIFKTNNIIIKHNIETKTNTYTNATIAVFLCNSIYFLSVYVYNRRRNKKIYI